MPHANYTDFYDDLQMPPNMTASITKVNTIKKLDKKKEEKKRINFIPESVSFVFQLISYLLSSGAFRINKYNYFK